MTNIPVQLYRATDELSLNASSERALQKLNIVLDEYVVNVRNDLKSTSSSLYYRCRSAEFATLMRYFRDAVKDYITSHYKPNVLNDLSEFTRVVNARFQQRQDRGCQLALLSRILRLEQGYQTLSEYADSGERLRRGMIGEYERVLAQTWVAGLSDQALADMITPIPSIKQVRSPVLEMTARARVMENVITLNDDMERVRFDVAELEGTMARWHFGPRSPRQITSSMGNSIAKLEKRARDCEEQLRRLKQINNSRR